MSFVTAIVVKRVTSDTTGRLDFIMMFTITVTIRPSLLLYIQHI